MKQTLFLQPSLDRLRIAVLEQNRIGSVEGLLSHHIIGADPKIHIEWQVGCTQEWVDKEFKPINLDHVAALGYFLWSHPTSKFRPQLLEGLSRVRERDAFKGEHLSLARNPTRLLGVILGSLAVGPEGQETLHWCQGVLNKVKQKGLAGSDPLVPYLFFRAFNTKIPISTHTGSSLYELSFMDWVVRHEMQSHSPSKEKLEEDRGNILFQATADLQFESASQAAIIWSSIESILFHALNAASLQPKHVAAVLTNFEPAMKRWRWDAGSLQNPIRWPINHEREVQDILWLILRSYFSDVVDEDALPKLGHSTYKADFGIGSLKLIIETKFAGSKDDFKKIEKEVQEDCVPYLRDIRYESLIVFIYDDSASVQEHDTTRRALMEIPGIVDVVIVSRPSQLGAQTSPQSTLKASKKK